jgi:hypothetical protein
MTPGTARRAVMSNWTGRLHKPLQSLPNGSRLSCGALVKE